MLFTARIAFAQQNNEAAAQALFERGRDLLRAGKAAEACPVLAESQRLDPATGTLMALALCHEAEGKLASAWAEFVDVEARARNEGRADREQVAHEHAQQLKPRLSTLEIRVPSELGALSGLEIRRNGVVQGSGGWNLAMPVDSAEYVIAISAPGKVAWQKSVRVKPESDAAVLQAPTELQAAPPTPRPEPSPAPVAPRTGWGTLEWAGIAGAGAGVVALGVGGYFLSSALGKKSDSSADCSGNVCGDTGYEQRASAVSHGNVATALGITGGVLVAGGVTLFFVGRSQSRSAHSDSSAHFALSHASLALGAAPGGMTARFSTPF